MQLIGTVLFLSLLAPAPGIAQTRDLAPGLRYQVFSEPGEQPVYKNLPADVKMQGGFIVGDVSIAQPYMVAVFQQGDRRMLGFERILSNQVTERPNGYANNQTIRVLDVAEIAKDGNLLTACYVGDEKDPEIFALVRYDDRNIQLQWITQFHQLWRANRTAQKLEPVRVPNVRCLNPGWGV